MAKQYDNVSRYLLGLDTVSWARFLGIKTDEAELVNADFSTVTSQADAMMLLGHDRSEAAHVEIQAGYDPSIGNRVLLYYALGVKSLSVPLRSYLVLLRPEADGPAIDGTVKHVDPRTGKVILQFHYEVIRVWEQRSEDLAEGGLGVLPLAFIAKIDPEKLPELVDRVQKRLDREVAPGIAKEFWTSIGILMGLKYSQPFIWQLLKGVHAMKESTFYQGILEEGKALGEARGEARGRRESLIRVGVAKFGQPDASTREALQAIASPQQLDQLLDRALLVSSWAELLGK